MADVKWIKITTDIFDDEKILLIESLPSADSIIVIWFKLLVFAGKQNNNGVFIMMDRIAYTEEMLASVFRRDISTIRLALNTLEQFGMIEIIDKVITIPKWHKYQTLDAYEKKKERDRQYQQQRRTRQKLLVNQTINESSGECPLTRDNYKENPPEENKSSDNRLMSEDKSSCVAVSEEDKEIDIDKERDKELIVSKDTICSTDVQLVINVWNSLGLHKVTKIVSGTQRYSLLRKRIQEYGFEEVMKAVHLIRKCPFLMGNNSRGWQITFDWFVKPNNFPKVLDGNYLDKSAGSSPVKEPEGIVSEEVLPDEELVGDDWWK